MFINCPHCQALVATDPATDLPPLRCPRCAVVLREAARIPDPEAARAPTDAGDTADAAFAQAIGSATPLPTESLATADPAADTDAPDPYEADVPAMPAPLTLSTVEDAGKPQPVAGTGSDPEADAIRTSAASEAEPDPELDSGPDPNHAPAPTPVSAAAPASGKPAPNFARVRAPSAAAHGLHRWLLPSVIAGLSLLLMLQWILADREQLATDARWRPLVMQLCGVLRCSLPPWREPGAFALLDRDVRPHPSVPGALRVSATFRNDARWAQAWPDVVLTLSDVEGHAVGARAFAAGEYLGTAPTQNELASGQAATIRMDVLEPAPRVVAFAFDFR
ncbi:MAG: DUF3426 domain-containing protein [Luteimonas sp.]